jgi:hypothetical protein
MPSKRKDNFARSRVAQKRQPQPGNEAPEERSNLARINLDARAGRAGFRLGERVRIEANGMYAGQLGSIARLSQGAIPSATVKVDGGGTRQVRTIDLVAAPKGDAKG